ncbi:MAG: ArsB/NhaD family transporter [Candidatus Brocadiaceae bacterium]|nr:ArsB/NhaD family transporter [Candidatus Brocadiaceae bacterium]
MENVYLLLLIFLLVFIAVTFELANKTAVVLLGVALLITLNVIDEHSAVEKIDFETIILLLGMMTLVAIIKKTGFFSFLSIKIAELTKGNPLKVLLLFSSITATLSAFLDNVTTILIIIPIIIQLTRGMGIDPKIYIISQAIISNIGGTATLVGDPPNIIIGSKVGLTFNQFLSNLIIPVMITFAATLLYIWFTNRRKFQPINTNLTKIFTFQLLLEKIRFEFLHTKLDKILITKALGCLGIVISLFVTQTITHLTPSLIAISGAMLLFVISKVKVEEILEEVEWSTLLFFTGLFILVGTLEEYGILEWVAHNVFLKAGKNPNVIVLMVLWLSGIASGFLDNIPFTITMIPIVHLMSESVAIPQNILWWSLSLGACFGGNFTVIGASANIVSIGIAKRNKVSISFLEFMKSGTAIALISLVISSVYLTIYLWLAT